VTDTAYDPESTPFAAGCRLLAHEAWFETPSPRNPDIHSSAAQAARVGAQAGVEQLVLIHLPPFDESVQSLIAEADAELPGAIAGQDGLVLANVTA
jgi:ribonuclease BN (tRNA processing enzyme)